MATLRLWTFGNLTGRAQNVHHVTLDRDGVGLVLECSATSTKGYIGMVMSHDPEPKVSIDFNHTAQSSIFAPDQTKVVGGRTVRVLAW